MTLSRRRMLGLTGGIATVLGGLGLSGCGLSALGNTMSLREQTGNLLRSNLELPKAFGVPLPIPPVAKPTRTEGDADHYEIVQRGAEAEIIPGTTTRIMGYDGIFPGPTVVSRSGRPTVIRHRSTLSVPVSVHLHGGHTPAESDGGPMDLILPHKDWKPGHSHSGQPMPLQDTTVGHRDHTYPMHQRAATLWYHDHRMDFTAPQVYRGLAGFHLVHDDEEEALPLPRGDRDIPLMVCDRAFEANGTFRYPGVDRTMQEDPGVLDEYMEGVLGDVLLVNGAPWPELEVDAALYRLRILNASNARRYRFELDGGATMVQIGSDGGLLEHPVRHDRIDAAPAERFDILVDFSAFRPGDTVVLHNNLGEERTTEVMRFRVKRRVRDDEARIPKKLSTIEKLDPAKAVRTRDWHFARGNINGTPGWLINDKPFDPNRMDADPKLGDIEIWRFTSDVHHPMHIHLDPFQVLRRNQHGPSDYDKGWKDTADVRPSEVLEVAVRFHDYIGPYMLHCHNLEHEDMAMMSAFETR